MMSEPALPAWAREDAFAAKPEGGEFGAVDEKGGVEAFESLDALKAYLGTGRGRLAWVWTPEHPRLVAPEEVPGLSGTLKKRRLIFSVEDEDAAKRSLPFTGIAVLYGAYSYLQGTSPFGFPGVQFLVIAVFAFLYFTARPGWESYKAKKSAKALTRESLAGEIPEARFELWMESQKTPFTIVLLAIVSLVGLAQFMTPGLGIVDAGLDKIRYHNGETWRIFTAAFMHGNVIHFALNASALWYLGRRVEILARWPHLAGVFFLSMIGAGWATVSWLPRGISVGVSGVVCGLLGFLLVFETLHRALVPRPARRRLAGILVSLVVIGTVGFQFVDNAAHFGGLATGAVYGFLVFPKSSSPYRPIVLKRDYVLGGASLLLIAVSAVGAIMAMLMRAQ